MKIVIKDALKLCAVFMQMENVLLILEGSGLTLTADERAEAEKELAHLLRCANLVYHEIASEYVHLKKSQQITTTDGHINYSELSSQPIDIYSVKRNGINCRFKLYPSEIVTEKGEVEVHYTYLPTKAVLNGSLDFEEGRVSSRIIAYGTVAEYCIISGLYEEAQIWDKRYKDSLRSSIKTLKSVSLPERKW